MGTAAAERRTAISACRGALQAAHNAANLANIVDKEAAQMLRTAEGMARSAVSRLEFLGRELANKKKKQEKDVKCTDASMESTAAAAESAPLPAPRPRASRRRRGRGAREAVPPPAATEPVLPQDAVAGAPPSGRALRPQISRERSPRRESSPTSSSAASGPRHAPGGFRVGQTVVFCGLTSRPELVGVLATVVSIDKDAERVAVKVDSTGECVRVKPCNIKLTIFGAGGRQVL